MLLLVAIRIRSRISQFAIRLPHKKVTHKVGQKERKAPKKKKKKLAEEPKIEKLLAAIALKLAADAVCNVWHSHSHSQDGTGQARPAWDSVRLLQELTTLFSSVFSRWPKAAKSALRVASDELNL